MSKEFIRIGGAREHNLKNLTLQIPRDQLVVVTGLSGSGKSSLAFDTIYAEGQRKYVESLSAYARQFLDQMQKPDVDFIEGLSPAIAIEQRSSGSSPRSIIATTTEIYDHLRLAYAHIGRPHCPESGVPIVAQSASDIVDKILALPPKTKIMILAPVVRRQKGEFRDVIERLGREGFVRARVDGELVELGDSTQRIKLDKKKFHNIEAVVDRLVMDEKIRVRLSDSVETALRWGEGVIFTLHQEGGTKSDTWMETLHSNKMCSPATGKSYDPPTPKHFSFNAPAGACPVCHGLGQKMIFDEALVVPDPELPLDGAIQPWRRAGKRLAIYYKAMLRSVAEHGGVSTETPYKDLPESFTKLLMHGSGDKDVEFKFWRGGKISSIHRPFEGVLPNLERLATDSESEFIRNRLKAYMAPEFCEACKGRRLKPEILAVTLGDTAMAAQYGLKPNKLKIPGLSIMDVCGLSVEKADDFFASLKLTDFQMKIAGEVIKEVRARLGFLKNVGLGYLTLDRESSTLSGGEAQRIRLATQIGAALVGVLYVLDEPSIGLHQRDNDRLLATLKGLRDLGNTVLVVEHDADTIRAADYILDLGPGAGVAAPAQDDNGDEARYSDKSGTYTKGVKQTSVGLVDLAAYGTFRMALDSGLPTDFDAIQVGGGPKKLNGPQGGLAFNLDCLENSQFCVPKAPAVASEDYAVELVELYWASLLRDVAFVDYPGNAIAVDAAAELTKLHAHYRGPKNGKTVTPELLFRGGFLGEGDGPYLSQFLLHDTSFGALPIVQKYNTAAPCVDYMKDAGSYQAVQNGANPVQPPAQAPMYLWNGRGLTTYTHSDVLYQAYMTAYLVLEDLRASGGLKFNPGNPYNNSATQNGFGTFGGPDPSAVLGAVASAALKAVWYQKWFVHLRHRPESGGALVYLQNTPSEPRAEAKVSKTVLHSRALACSVETNKSYFLSQAFPEGSPVHPAYPTGHGAVAGACITVLKFFYDGAFQLPKVLVPSLDGTVPTDTYSGPALTVNGELNKLACNISFGHGIHAGIHWRSDTESSVRLGEQVALSYLRNYGKAYNEKFSVEMEMVDGGTVRVGN